MNGERMGVYANVDAVKKPFLKRNFEDGGGPVYEGTISDFRPGWTGTFEQKTDKDNATTRVLDALTDALLVDDADLFDALEDVIDLQQFYTFWATETLVSHWDGYSGNTNNFFIYDDPTSGKGLFMPWGTDGTFIPPRLVFEDENAPDSVFAVGILTRRLYDFPEGRARYFAELDRLFQNVWDEDALSADIDQMVALIEPHLEDERQSVLGAAEDVRAFMNARRSVINAEREEGVEFETPLREDICRPQIGELDFTFSTTYGTHPAQALNYQNTGTVTGTGQLFERDFAEATIGAGAGTEPEGGNAGNEVVIIEIERRQEARHFLYVTAAPGIFNAETSYTLESDELSAFIFRVAPRFQIIGAFYEGTFSLNAFGTDAGAEVQGRLEGKLLGF